MSEDLEIRMGHIRQLFAADRGKECKGETMDAYLLAVYATLQDAPQPAPGHLAGALAGMRRGRGR